MSATPPIVHRCPECHSPLPSVRVMGLCAACLWETVEGSRVEVPDPAASIGAPVVLLRLPGLDLEEVIARGGMGVVYRARDLEAGRTVAVKMLLPQDAENQAMRTRFRQEAGAVATMDHPGILPVYRVGEHDGLPYFSMKLAGGGSLAERLESYRGQWRRIAELMAEIADAVQHAHSRGVLHRDLKPANILFDASGRAYVSDFGLVKITGAESTLTLSVAMLGTPDYMSPEVAAQDARHATTESDVWSLGAMLYELLAQRRPFAAAGVPALLRSIVEDSPASLSGIHGLPTDLATIALKCLSREPAGRYHSAAGLAADLRAWLEGRPVAAHPPSHTEHLRLWVRRNKAISAMAALLLLLLTAGAVMLVLKNRTLGRSLAAEQLARATALRTGGDIRQRNEALGLLRSAAESGDVNHAEARDEAITLLAAPGWRELRRIPWNVDSSPAVMPDFSRLIRIEDGTLELLPFDSTLPEEKVKCPEAALSIVFARNHPARLFVQTGSGASRKTLRLYNVESRAWTAMWPGRESVALCPLGRWMASSTSNSQEITLEDLTGATPTRTIRSGLAAPQVQQLTSDGALLTIVCEKTGRIELMDTATGTPAGRLTVPWRRQKPVQTAWQPGGGLAVTSDIPDIFLYHVDGKETWSRRITGHHTEITRIAWHPRGEWLVSTSFDSQLRIWEATSGRELMRTPAGADQVAFSEDGTRLCYRDPVHRVIVLCAFDVPTIVRQVHLPHSDPDKTRQRGPWGVALTPDGRAAAIAGAKTWLLEADSGAILETFRVGFGSHALITEDGGSLFIGQSDGVLRSALTCDDRGRWSAAPPEPLATGHAAWRMAWGATARALAVTADSGVWLYQDGIARPRHFPTPSSVNPVAVSPDARWLVAVPAIEQPRQTSWLFDTARQESASVSELPLPRLSYPSFSPDGRTLFATSGGKLTAFETGSWRPRWSVALGQSQEPNLIAISGDGRVIANSLLPYGIQLRSTSTGALLTTLRHPDRRLIRWLALDHKATRLAANGSSHVIQLWDLAGLNRELAKFGLDWKE